MNITSTLAIAFALTVISGVSTVSHALPVSPTSYDMPNGYGKKAGGEYNYWDSKYTGSGSKIDDGAYLSGGLGELTDGIIATKSWEVGLDTTENIDGTGPYVGWSWGDPTITFHFNNEFIKNVTFYVDDPVVDASTGAGHGGVSAPLGFTINGIYYPHFSTSNPSPSAGPLAMVTELNLANIDTLTITLNRHISKDLFWVFASEVAFDDGRNPVPAPEPATVALFGAGLAGLALLKLRKKK